jgi:alkanesulfonate monooxygenase SsuD/methylene tetrahydromethanopterin reductase-like flavin-dependent oxidoreductase (luciferase family)
MTLEFGVFLTPSSATPDAVVELAVLADQVGLDLVTFQDHPYQPNLLDAWTLLSYVAGKTERVRLAPNVLNLPLRPPAVVARAVAALDLLSGGRAELGIGAGGFWDAIEHMGGRRLTPGQGVDALEEAIDLMRALWDGEGRVTIEGSYYGVTRATAGPTPRHAPEIWIGAYKPRMLALTGRKGDGWLPSLPYLQDGDLAAGNAAIDRAAHAAGRDPSAIRRMLNLALPEDPVAELTRLAVDERVDTFIVMTDDRRVIEALAPIAQAVRAAVEGGERQVRRVEHDEVDARSAGRAQRWRGGPAAATSPSSGEAKSVPAHPARRVTASRSNGVDRRRRGHRVAEAAAT